MKVQVEDISPIKKKMTFEVPQENFQKSLEKAYQKLQKTTQIKGFRKGKVPRAILEKYYGAKTSMETLSELVDQSYRDAIQENQILAIGMPKIDDLKMEENTPITFVAEVEVQPKVEAKHFEKISVSRPKIEINDEDIAGELLNLRKSQAQWLPEEEGKAAEKDHLVTINFKGTVDGKPFEGGSGENLSLQLGSGRFLPDFEKGLMGAKVNEERTFEVPFPENYGVAALKGKTAKFEAKITEIKREDLPTLDDEFAKDLGKYETLAQLKDEIRQHQQKSREQQQRSDVLQQILKHLIDKNSFEIPESMITMELDYMWKNLVQQLSEQKLTPAAIGMTEEDYREKNRDEATKRIKGFLLFDSIAVQNDLKVTPEEMDAKLQELADSYQQPLEVVRKFYQEQGLIRQVFNHILEEKTLNFILAKADIHE